MPKGFFRELRHYTLFEISQEIGESSKVTKYLVGILKKYGVVKAVKKVKPEYEDLSNQDIVLTDVMDNGSDIVYVFDYVGIVLIEGHAFKCYPKYISSCKEPIAELKQVLKVIQKYNSKEQLVFLYNGEDDSKIFNRLAVILHLLEDYYIHGLYTKQHEVVETNGEGEILWDRTINETFALIQDNRPYYVELQTQNVVDNDIDFFNRLHKCILTQCAQELEKAGLEDLFEFANAEFTEEFLEDIGDTDFILYRLQCEMQMQYVSWKQSILKTLYTYVANNKVNKGEDSFSLYGTNSFNLVWEKVCADNFGSLRDEKLKNLPYGLSKAYEGQKNKTLKSMIDTPIWHRNQPPASGGKVKTLIPDLICIYPCNEEMEPCFGIFDAKYYNIEFTDPDGKVSGQPGVGDVTKQYLYQLAYDDFIEKQGYPYVQNLFLCPQEQAEPGFGYVKMGMLQSIGNKRMEDIAVVKLCAEKMYEIYLSNDKIDNVADYIPQANRRLTAGQNVISRVTKLFEKHMNQSLEAGQRLGMQDKQGKFIYPVQLRREIGAKLLYDLLCPIAADSLYGMNPDGSEAGETEQCDEICSQIAEAALRIDHGIRALSELELLDKAVMKVNLQRCFNGLNNIQAMVQGQYLEDMLQRVMEFAEELYL